MEDALGYISKIAVKQIPGSKGLMFGSKFIAQSLCLPSNQPLINQTTASNWLTGSQRDRKYFIREWLKVCHYKTNIHSSFSSQDKHSFIIFITRRTFIHQFHHKTNIHSSFSLQDKHSFINFITRRTFIHQFHHKTNIHSSFSSQDEHSFKALICKTVPSKT